jgi:para-nitrobenzyl esterase
VVRPSCIWLTSLVAIAVCQLAATREPIRVDGGFVADVAADADGIKTFRGIPFAAPPIGNLRWRAPQPVSGWTGVRDASVAAKNCVQMGYERGSYYEREFYREPAPVSEDCLYLNIWTPAHAPRERRPVLVWIHGGGFAQGSGTTPSQGGQGLARKGVIVVTFNYRLGVFGLLAHPELTAESEHHASGNYALMDQIAALKWVQRNIAAFGGDPRQVTIFGQSAGSISGALLLTSPLAKGLFARVAGESDGFAARNQTLREAEEQGAQVGKTTAAPTLAALRALSADVLLRATDRQFQPIIDGYVIPEDAYGAYARGDQITVPVLLGSNANERGNYPQPKSVEEYRDFTRRQYSDAVEDVMKMFPVSSNEEATKTYLYRQRDIVAAAMHTWAKFMMKSGAPAFVYYFDRKPPARAGEVPLGAVHTAEIVYFRNLLDTVDRPWTRDDRKLADVMSSYLANFATTGDPNRSGLPNWPRYTPDRVMELGDRVGPMPTPDRAELTWFDEYFAKHHARARSSSALGPAR